MNLEILEHNKTTGVVKLRFTHGNVVHIDRYDLKLVVPGTERILQEYGMEFDEVMQQKVIDKLAVQIERDIDAGILHNQP